MPVNDVAKTIIHIIGERPGTPHNNFSIYITSATAEDWSDLVKIDHNRTVVVSGISDTALKPDHAVDQVLRLVKEQVELNSLKPDMVEKSIKRCVGALAK